MQASPESTVRLVCGQNVWRLSCVGYREIILRKAGKVSSVFLPLRLRFAMSNAFREIYEFGPFRMDVDEHVFRRLDGTANNPLPEKAFQTLVFLLRKRGSLVTKGELLDAVWPDTVVEENNLDKAIHSVRQALGEKPSENRYIETVRKHGYRFVAEVVVVDPLMADTKQPEGTPDATLPMREGKAVWVRKTIYGTFAAAVVGAIAIGYVLLSRGPVPNAKVPSILILPVHPINPKEREDLMELGITHSLIHRLGSSRQLRVRALNEARRYLNSDQDPLAAGREQQTDFVLASNYQRYDGRIKITAQLIDVTTADIEETYSYEESAADLFATQDVISGKIAERLVRRFSVDFPLRARQGTRNEEAFRQYLQGRNLSNQRLTGDPTKALEYFENAIRLDPEFAGAYAGLANAYHVYGIFAGDSIKANENAKQVLEKALELDGDMAEAYAVRAKIRFAYDWDFSRAESDCRRAIEIDPNNDEAYWTLAMVSVYRGQFDEALQAIDTALIIAPAAVVYHRDRGRILYFARRYDEAIVQLKRTLEIDPDYKTSFIWIRLSYEMKGDDASAFEWFLKDQEFLNPDRVAIFKDLYQDGGWQAVRKQHLDFLKLDQSKPNRLWVLIRQAAQLGDKDLAFELLNKAVERRIMQVATLKVDPPLDPIRDDPRYLKILGSLRF